MAPSDRGRLATGVGHKFPIYGCEMRQIGEYMYMSWGDGS